MAVDAFQRTTDQFTNWFLSQPSASISPKLSIADFRTRGAGRGAVAVEDIEEDEELFRIPRNSIISVANSALPKQLPGETWNKLQEDPWSALILVLLYESLQGNSIWRPYLDILPAEFDTLMFWSEVELEELQASAIRDKIGKQSADEMFRSQIIPLVNANADIFYASNGHRLDDQQLMAMCHRLGSTIMAYAFDLQPSEEDVRADEDGYATEDEDENLQKGMVPLADMLNADADFNSHLFHEKEALIMRSVRSIAKGEEILNDYGPLPRADLLRRYGYITPKYAKYDVVEIPFQLVLDQIKTRRPLSESQLEDRMDYLEERECVDEGYLIEWRDATAETPQDQASLPLDNVNIQNELLQVVGSLLAEDGECRNAAKSFENCSPKVKDQCCEVLVNILGERLRQYSTTSEEDKDILGKPHVLGRQRMAIEVRLGEKTLLEVARAQMRSKTRLATSGTEPTAERASKRQKTS